MKKLIVKIHKYIIGRYNRFLDDKLIKKLLATIADNGERKVTEQLLINQMNYLNSVAEYSPQVQNRKQKTLMMKVAAKVIGRLLVMRGIVGVQPMQGPVGLVYSMQYKQELEETASASPRLSLQVLTNAVEAKSRKLQTGFMLEMAQDMQAMHGIDAEAEISEVLAFEIAHEIHIEVLADLVKLAAHSQFEAADKTGVRNKAQAMMIKLNQEATSIAAKTRRGPGNILVVSPTVLSIFQMMRVSGISLKAVEKRTDDMALRHVYDMVSKLSTGEEHVMFHIFLSMAPSIADANGNDKILMMYKGPNEIDTGYVYTPYIPIMPNGPVVDPATYQPRITLMTRYGKHMNNNDGGMSDSHHYYRVIEINTKDWLTDVLGIVDNTELPS